MSAAVKTWEQRCLPEDAQWLGSVAVRAMKAEIADLRAALAAKTEGVVPLTCESLAEILRETIDSPVPVLTEQEMTDICTSRGWSLEAAPKFRDIALVFWVNGALTERRESAAPAVQQGGEAALTSYNEGYADGMIAIKDSVKAIRDRALEEAAQLSESMNSHGQFISDHIRALKTKPAATEDDDKP